MLRVGLIGFGSIAEHAHLPAWQWFPHVQVTAVADLSPQRMARAAELLPAARLYAEPSALIDDASIDVLDICSPPNTHADLIVAACRRGIEGIVCEKPFVLREDDYRRIALAWAGSGSRVVSVNNWLHSDLFRHVDALIKEGTIGSVREVELHTGRPDAAKGNVGWNPGWRTNPAYAGGGIILDHGWHQLYMLMGWMRATPRCVSARTDISNPAHYPVEDEAIIDLSFEAGYGRIELSWTAEGRSNWGVIRGTDGHISIDDDRVVVHNSSITREIALGERLTQSSYHPDWFHEMFRSAIIDVTRNEADRNFAEAGVLVETICAAYRSAREGGAQQQVARTCGMMSGWQPGEDNYDVGGMRWIGTAGQCTE